MQAGKQVFCLKMEQLGDLCALGQKQAVLPGDHLEPFFYPWDIEDLSPVPRAEHDMIIDE